MSDNIPFEIQAEIVKRLPVKSLLQFRSVSKAWKSVIDGSDFIAGYRSQQHHLLVSYVGLGSCHLKYVSIVDDDTFPRQRVSLPVVVKLLKNYDIIGSCCGLLCLYGDFREGRKGPISGSAKVVLLNLSIRKTVAAVVRNVANRNGEGLFRTVLGFGVCRETNDPKIVKITSGSNSRGEDMESVVEVLTLSLGGWRNPYGNRPRKSIEFSSSQFVNGCLYWLAIDRITMDGETGSVYNLIVSFDMTSEEFREVNLPGNLVHLPHDKLSLSKVSESLVVIENGVEDVWMMEDGVSKSFTKLSNVNVYNPGAQVSRCRGFRKTGEPIIEIVQHNLHGQLVVYEADTKHVDELEIDGTKFSFSVYTYMETLLLLDQPAKSYSWISLTWSSG